MKYNPGIEIIVYTSSSSKDILVDWKTDEHSVPIVNTVPFSSLNDFRSRIKIVHVDFQEEYNISNDISVVHKADFLRIAKLYEHGGVWFDFDILFIRPIPAFIFGVSPTKLFCFYYLNCIPTGFLASRPKTDIMELLVVRAKELVMEPGGYQKIGPDLWTTMVRDNSHLLIDITRLTVDIIYPYEPHSIHEILKIAGGVNRVTENTIGIHWYNGSTAIKNFINKSVNSLMYPHRCILNQYIHKVRTDPFL